MTLSKDFLDYIKELEGEDFTLNHIPYDDPRLKKLQELAKPKSERQIKPKQIPKVVSIIGRERQFYDFENVEWDVIKLNRVNDNLTQNEVAEMAGISRVVYQQYETGRMRATKRRIKDICNVLGLEVKERKIDHRRLDNVNCKKIKKKRKKMKLTQTALAESVGISPRIYSKYENEERRWSVSSLMKVCKKLGLDYKKVTKDDTHAR